MKSFRFFSDPGKYKYFIQTSNVFYMFPEYAVLLHSNFTKNVQGAEAEKCVKRNWIE